MTTLSNIARAGNAPCKLVYALIPTVAERGAVTNVDAVVAVRAALTAQLQDFEVVEAALECLSRLSKDPASRVRTWPQRSHPFAFHMENVGVCFLSLHLSALTHDIFPCRGPLTRPSLLPSWASKWVMHTRRQ